MCYMLKNFAFGRRTDNDRRINNYVRNGQQDNLVDPTANQIYVQGKELQQEKAQNTNTVTNSNMCLKAKFNEKLDQFLDKAKRESEIIKQERNKSSKSQTSEKVVSPNTPVQSATQNEANTPCERFFSMIKTQAATLESDMVNFKQEILKSLEDVMETLEQKDNQIVLLNDKISQARSNDIVRKQTISDLSLKQHEQQEEINKLKHTIKNQQQQIQSLKLKFNTLRFHNVPSSSEPHTQIQDQDENPEPNEYPDHPSSNEARSVTTNRQPKSPEPSSQGKLSFSVPTKNQFSPSNDEASAADPTEVSSRYPDHQALDNDYSIPTVKTYNGETIVMCDSNGRLLNIKRLCPKSLYSYIRCPTLKHAEEIISTSVFTNPKTLIFHCGTNDLDHNIDNSKICSDTLKVIDQIKKIKEKCTNKMCFTKQLNEFGIRVFTKNLKASFFQVNGDSTGIRKTNDKQSTPSRDGQNNKVSQDSPKPTWVQDNPHQAPATNEQHKSTPLMNVGLPPGFIPSTSNFEPPYFNPPAFNAIPGFIPPPFLLPTNYSTTPPNIPPTHFSNQAINLPEANIPPIPANPTKVHQPPRKIHIQHQSTQVYHLTWFNSSN
ncbi:Hypothetical predicted protein [Paramuricea clavata]|uniref:Uncharacterized protein n=1 Tax=Paramuricea clavata TaxID=317549 RepID=A0A7D9EW05_PARCT|nr:Hypothetical predicted protein [Paramuricea clavata]